MCLQIIQALIPPRQGHDTLYDVSFYCAKRRRWISSPRLSTINPSFHVHVVVGHREERFQAVSGYMKPESDVQWLHKKRKNHLKAGLIIQLRQRAVGQRGKSGGQTIWGTPFHGAAGQRGGRLDSSLTLSNFSFLGEDQGVCGRDPFCTWSTRWPDPISIDFFWKWRTAENHARPSSWERTGGSAERSGGTKMGERVGSGSAAVIRSTEYDPRGTESREKASEPNKILAALFLHLWRSGLAMLWMEPTLNARSGVLVDFISQTRKHTHIPRSTCCGTVD